MRINTVSEKCLLVLALPSLLCAACSSNHHVSPWGMLESPRLDAYVQRPDLDATLSLLDQETAHLRLSLTTEIKGKLPKGEGPVIIRAYQGTNTLGRPTYAVRAATAHGIILAVGPSDPADFVRDQATQLVPSISMSGGEEAVSFASANDLNGDGAPDLLLASPSGRLEIWRLLPLGATPYSIEMEASPTRALDVDHDGRIDFGGEISVDEHDPIAPRFSDLATFDGARFSNQSAAARAHHARLADTPSPSSAPTRPADRLRRALERAWHTILAGRSTDDIEKKLAQETVPEALRTSFERHTRRIMALKTRYTAPK